MTIEQILELEEVKSLSDENKEVLTRMMTNFLRARELEELVNIDVTDQDVLDFAESVARLLQANRS